MDEKGGGVKKRLERHAKSIDYNNAIEGGLVEKKVRQELTAKGHQCGSRRRRPTLLQRSIAEIYRQDWELRVMLGSRGKELSKKQDMEVKEHPWGWSSSNNPWAQPKADGKVKMEKGGRGFPF